MLNISQRSQILCTELVANTCRIEGKELRCTSVSQINQVDKWMGACTKFGTIVFQHHVRGVRLGERVAAEPNKQNAHINRFS